MPKPDFCEISWCEEHVEHVEHVRFLDSAIVYTMRGDPVPLGASLVGVINTGREVRIHVDGVEYALPPEACTWIHRLSKMLKKHTYSGKKEEDK